MKNLLCVSAAILAAAASVPASAATFTEDFNDTFPAWEGRWFGALSNASNFSSDPSYRGNNVTGLSVDDGDFFDGGQIRVNFDTSFAASITDLAFDLLAFNGQTLSVFDKDGAVLTSFAVPVTSGPCCGQQFFSDLDYAQSAYTPFSISSTNGIGGFYFGPFGGSGNVSIDNISVTTAGAVPEPASWAMLISGFGLVGSALRRRQKQIKVTYA